MRGVELQQEVRAEPIHTVGLDRDEHPPLLRMYQPVIQRRGSCESSDLEPSSKQEYGDECHDNTRGFGVVEPLAEAHDANADEHQHAYHRAEDTCGRQF